MRPGHWQASSSVSSRFNEAAGADPADAARMGRTLGGNPGFNEAAGADPADACPRARDPSSPKPRFNEAAGADPADAAAIGADRGTKTMLQ